MPPLQAPPIRPTIPPGIVPGERRITYEQLLNKPGTPGTTGSGGGSGGSGGTTVTIPLAAIPGQTTTTRKFLRSVGNGVVAGTPTWDTILAADVTPGSFQLGVFHFGVAGALANAPLSAIQDGSSFEFGHSNNVGYHGTLGAELAVGRNFLAFHGEAGTAAGYRTRGKLASILRADLTGGVEFGTVANAAADNQALVSIATLSSAGVFTTAAGVFGLTGALAAAPLSAVANGSCFEFGHSNNAGYHSALGAEAASGKNFVALQGEAASGGAGNYRTRGNKASILRADLTGGWEFGTVANANADNQPFVPVATLTGAGVFTAPTISGVIKVSNAFVAGVPAATGTIKLTDSTGTVYRVLCVP